MKNLGKVLVIWNVSFFVVMFVSLVFNAVDFVNDAPHKSGPPSTYGLAFFIIGLLLNSALTAAWISVKLEESK